MASKVKAMLINKVMPNHLNKESFLRSATNFHISYKHNEKCFLLNLSSKKLQNSVTTSQVSNNIVSNSETVQVDIDRETFISTVLTHIISSKKPQVNEDPQTIVIDFSSPNIAKPFHAGHLRSTIIGNFIGNVNQHFNNKVTRINYLGDWGTQFGLLQYGLKAKNIDINGLKNNPMKALYEAYVYANKLSSTDESIQEQARDYFADIEQGRTSLENWMKIREITVEELEIVYKRLGIKFDSYHWESDYNGGAIKDILNLLEENNVIKTDESGKKVARIKNRDVTILKSDKSTLYLSRDIAALLDRYKRYNFNKMLYVVDNSQTDHFAALFEIVKQINEECTKGCQHIKFGRIKGMSTRAGNVVFLSDILDEAKQKMYDQQLQSKNTRNSAMNEETCDILGTTAVIINDLKQKRLKDYTFSWDRVLQSEGDSGIRLQYLHCRLWSLEKNSGLAIPQTCDPTAIPEEIVGDVVAELARFEDILSRSLEEYEACVIVNYLFRLARHVNRMFNELRVNNASPDLAAQRLLVFHSARVVVKTCLEILGVKPLYEM
ncbi:probable arginine--tRNA ligase, mitochondrial [Pectinophora gossypiella]|uniref:probable arginine--tRNA ligase, mitochondrial n=1 Tax=Pectinophora gossypiella TaxID=13191 RepID=UPI00214E1DA1|nr:probable arginine--tRNA ligase, mitochondrial [Pectinophora gossypiella]